MRACLNSAQGMWLVVTGKIQWGNKVRLPQEEIRSGYHKNHAFTNIASHQSCWEAFQQLKAVWQENAIWGISPNVHEVLQISLNACQCILHYLGCAYTCSYTITCRHLYLTTPQSTCNSNHASQSLADNWCFPLPQLVSGTTRGRAAFSTVVMPRYAFTWGWFTGVEAWGSWMCSNCMLFMQTVKNHTNYYKWLSHVGEFPLLTSGTSSQSYKTKTI